MTLEIHDYTRADVQDNGRAELEAKLGKVYDTQELREAFDVLSFAAPFIVAVRKSDGVKGTLEFTHNPRFYFAFNPR